MQMVGEIGRKDKGSVNVQISLKALVLVIPKTPIARRELEEDFDEDRMQRLAEQAMEYQGRGNSVGVGGRSSKSVRPHRPVQTGKVDRLGLERDLWIQAGRLRVGFTDQQVHCWPI